MNPVVDLAIRATAFMLIGALAWRLMKRGSAESRCGVLRATFVGLAILPLAAYLGPRWEPVLPWVEKPAPITVDFTGVDIGDEALPEPVSRAVEQVEIPWGWLAWAGLAAAVTLPSLLGLRSLRGLWRSASSPNPALSIEVLRALDEMGVKSKVELRLGSVGSPLVFGVKRPHILLPLAFGDWPEAHRRSALLHEAAHIRRFDCAWLTLASAVRAVYACHPLVWWLSGALKDETELAADERAIRSGVEATDYASALVAIARDLQITRGVVRSQGVTFMNHRQLDRRVRGALSTRRRGFTLIGSLTLMGSALATVFGIGSIHPQAPQQEVIFVSSGEPIETQVAPSSEIPLDFYMGPDELTPTDYAVHAAQTSSHQKKSTSKNKSKKAETKKATAKPLELFWRSPNGALNTSRAFTGTLRYAPKFKGITTTQWRTPLLATVAQRPTKNQGVPYLKDIPLIGRMFRSNAPIQNEAPAPFSRVPIINRFFQKTGDDSAKPTPNYQITYSSAVNSLFHAEYKPLVSFTTARGAQVSDEDSKKARELVEKLLKDAKGTSQEADLRRLLELLSKANAEPKELALRERALDKLRADSEATAAQRVAIEAKLMEAKSKDAGLEAKEVKRLLETRRIENREAEAKLKEEVTRITSAQSDQIAKERLLIERSRGQQVEIEAKRKAEQDLARTLTTTVRLRDLKEAELARVTARTSEKMVKLQEERLAKVRRTQAVNLAPLQLELARVAGRNQSLNVSQVLSQGGVLEIKIVDEKGRVQTLHIKPDQIKRTITLKRDKNGKLQVINK